MLNILRRIYFNLAYLGRPRWDTRKSPPELFEFIQNNPVGRALDLGCGTGTNLITLAQAGWKIIGVDYVPLATKIARRRLNLLNLKGQVLNSDVANLPLIQAPFDLILDIGCYHNLNLMDRVAYCHNVERLLAPSGTWLLYVHLSTGTRIGVLESEIVSLAERFQLVKRQEGIDGSRKSNWLWFQLPISEA